MKKSSNIDQIKNDYLNAEKFCNSNKNSIANEKSFNSMFIDYAEYITAVVEHLSFTEYFKGNSSTDTRAMMEEYNAKRTRAHDKAIDSTIRINNELIKNGVIYNSNIWGAENKNDLTAQQRQGLGNFIFKMSSIRSLILSERNLNKENNITKIDIASEKLRKTSHDYKVTINDDEEDIYKQIKSNNDKEMLL